MIIILLPPHTLNGKSRSSKRKSHRLLHLNTNKKSLNFFIFVIQNQIDYTGKLIGLRKMNTQHYIEQGNFNYSV